MNTPTKSQPRWRHSRKITVANRNTMTTESDLLRAINWFELHDYKPTAAALLAIWRERFGGGK